MTEDQRLRQLLRDALPSPGEIDAIDVAQPSRDLWPAVVEWAGAREHVSAADMSVAAIVAIVLLMFPQWFWFLAYHL
jgi:hypothetical protein